MLSEVTAHVQLVWDNCKTFNDPSTVVIMQEIYQMSAYLEKLTRNYCHKLKIPFSVANIKQLRKEEPVILEDPKKVSFEEKWEFTERVRKLQQRTIEKIVEIIGEECAPALERGENNRVKIKLDVMDISRIAGLAIKSYIARAQERGIILQAVIDEDLPLVQGDSQKISWALSQLTSSKR